MQQILYAGSYVAKGAPGVQRLCLQGTELCCTASCRELQSPSYLCETTAGLLVAEESATSAAILRLDPQSLTILDRLPLPGSGLCHISTSGKYAYGACYESGAVVGVNLQSGSTCAFVQHEGISAHLTRQSAPHVHSTLPLCNEILVADLGLDKIFRYCQARDGHLIPHAAQPFFTTAAGEGPRHFALTGKDLYLCTELKCNLYAISIESDKMIGRSITPLFPTAVPVDASGADIHATPNGAFLYVSLRGTHEVVGFRLEKGSAPTSIGRWHSGGQTPRSFHISKDGLLLAVANQDSNNISIFPLCPKTGVLGSEITRYTMPNVSCVKWAGSVVEGKGLHYDTYL